MIRAKDLIPFRNPNDPDEREAKSIEKLIETKRQQTSGAFLTKNEFVRIAKWKLRTQFNRTARYYKPLNDDVLELVTKSVFNVVHPDPQYLLKLRFNLLCSISRINMGVGSAIMGLGFPDKYCVIDYRGWRQIFPHSVSKGPTVQRKFTQGEYFKYLDAVRNLANQLTWSIRETDSAIWAYDKGING